MGIPFEVCLDVLDNCLPELIGLKRQVAQLQTSHIRKAVASSLYKLNQDLYSEDQIQAWGDAYVRRYGNPSSRILVLTENDIEPLSYKFLKKKLLPALFETVIGSKQFSYLINSSRKREEERMARQIIRAIKNLDLGRIHYQTLLDLSKDLALQPPHPWLVPKAFDYGSILYDYERASFHASKVRIMLKDGTTKDGNYPIRECIHHSSSGILAMYGVFMGCGYLAPFYNIIYHLKQIIDGNTDNLFNYSKIEALPSDLNSIGKNIMSLYKILKKLQKDENLTTNKLNQNITQTCEISLDTHYTFKKIFELYYPGQVPELA